MVAEQVAPEAALRIERRVVTEPVAPTTSVGPLVVAVTDSALSVPWTGTAPAAPPP